MSPDGATAASGTHLYSLKTRKPIRELPFPRLQPPAAAKKDAGVRAPATK